MSVTTLFPEFPAAPNRSTDTPATFSSKADAFIAAMYNFPATANTTVEEMNTLLDSVNTYQINAGASATSAASSATSSANSATLSRQYKEAAEAAVAQIDAGVEGVANMTALRAITPTGDGQFVNLLGYYTIGDGGGGIFYWNASSTDTDNGGTIIEPTAGGTGRWKRVFSGNIDARWFLQNQTSTSQTTELQTMINTAISLGCDIDFIDIDFAVDCDEPSGVYSASAVIDGAENLTLRARNCTITVIGGGVANYHSIFRVIRSKNVYILGFSADGNFNPNGYTGSGFTGGFAFVVGATYDVLNSNKGVDYGDDSLDGLFVKYNHCENFAGFVAIARKNPSFDDVSFAKRVYVRHNTGVDCTLYANTITLYKTRDFNVSENYFVNSDQGSSVSPFAGLYIDASSGCRDGVIERNFGSYYVFGIKSETSTNVGVSGTEIRRSRNIKIRDNILIYLGDPTSLTGGAGSATGDTYGIKMYSSENNECSGNTVISRSDGAYPLSFGIQVNATTGAVKGSDIANNIVSNNFVNGANNSFVHTDGSTPDGTITCNVFGNKFKDANGSGLILQHNIRAYDNEIVNCVHGASMQLCNDTFLEDNNRFINCGSSVSTVINQSDTPTGRFSIKGNKFEDTRTSNLPPYVYNIAAGYAHDYQFQDNTYNYVVSVPEASSEIIPKFTNNRDTLVKSYGLIQYTNAWEVKQGYNIGSISLVDAYTIQVNFKRALPDNQFIPMVQTQTNQLRTLTVQNATTSSFQVKAWDNTGTAASAVPFYFKII